MLGHLGTDTFAPTGKILDFEEVQIVRISDDRIGEHWGVADSGALIRQLGIDPPG